jgi:hypothetical protein
VETQGPLTFLFVVSPRCWRGAQTAAADVAHSPRSSSSFAGRFAYLPFGEWWYLRFLLPAFAFVFILAAEPHWLGTARLGAIGETWRSAVFTAVMVFYGASSSWKHDVLAIGRDEERYAEIRRYLKQALPQNAVVLLQHSGDVHTGRLTLRYDYLNPTGSIAPSNSCGSRCEPFFVLDDWKCRPSERSSRRRNTALW